MRGRKEIQKPIPEQFLEARRLTRVQFEMIANKYMNMNFSEIEHLMTKKKAEVPAIDFIVLSIIYHAIKEGDSKRLDFLLDRTIGQSIKRIAVQYEEENIMRDIPIEMTDSEKIKMAEKYAEKMKQIGRVVDVEKSAVSGADKPEV